MDYSLSTLKKILFIAILALGFLVRFFYTDRIPVAIGGDELDYVLTAKSVALTGSDLSGKWTPFSLLTFRYPPQEEPKAELSYINFLLPVGFFPLNLLSSRIVSILLGFLTIPILYLITRKLVNENAAIAVAFVAALNPWGIYAGRTAYEMVPASFFFLSAFAILLLAKRWNILWAIPFLVLGFLAYIATKILLFPFVFIIILYLIFFENRKKYLLQYGLVLGAVLALVLYYAFSITHGATTSRLNEIVSPSAPIFAQQVNGVRQASIQNAITETFENKGTMFVRYMVTKFFNVFSPDYLFVSGDSFYSLYRHGFFYVVDMVFLILGALFAFATKRKAFYFLTFLTLLSALPQLIHGTRNDNFSPHLALFFPLLTIFIGIGIYYCITIPKKLMGKSIVGIGIFIVYLIMVSNFFNIYFFQNSLSGNFDFSVRIFSHYISLTENTNTRVFVASPRSGDLYRKYIFYGNKLTQKNISSIKNSMSQQTYTLGSVKFGSCDNKMDTKSVGIVIYDAECGTLEKETSHIAVKRLSDQGESYRIYNDTICTDARRKNKTSKLSLASFNIEKLSLEYFCNIYFK